MQAFLNGLVDQMSTDPRENEIAMKLMNHLTTVRRDDPDSFDAMVGGQTLPRGYVMAYADTKRGRQYRGYKHESQLSPLEKYSMGYTLTERDKAVLRLQERPIG